MRIRLKRRRTLLIEVTTVDGSNMVINSEHIVIAGSVTDQGTPVVGVCKIMLLNGAALIVKEGVHEFKERVNAEATGRPVLSL